MKKQISKGEILLCEDNDMNRELIESCLTKMGYTVVIAGNGLEGIELVEGRIGKKPFDLIFMDIFMPVMDGLEAAEEILKLKVKTPIIAITASQSPAEKARYLSAGMSGFLGKPFTAQELRECLSRHLETDETGNDSPEDETLRLKLIRFFINNNKNKYKEISEAIQAGDRALAHRLSHTLKNNAGQLGKFRLQKAAADVEILLREEKKQVPKYKLEIMAVELEHVLEEFNADAWAQGEAKETETPPEKALDPTRVKILLIELETLLDGGDTECLNRIKDLRNIPGSGALIDYMENFQFNEAQKVLKSLQKEWM